MMQALEARIVYLIELSGVIDAYSSGLTDTFPRLAFASGPPPITTSSNPSGLSMRSHNLSRSRQCR